MKAEDLGGEDSSANKDTWHKTQKASQVLRGYLTEVHWYYT